MLKHIGALFTIVTLTLSQAKDSLTYYEKQFNPSMYDIKDLILPEQTFSSEIVEMVSGFRVQVLVTTRLDSANSVKNLVQTILSMSDFQNQEVYIIYEPPNYKVRVGDFEHLQEASLMQKFLIRNGFKYAWIVNDKVRKR